MIKLYFEKDSLINYECFYGYLCDNKMSHLRLTRSIECYSSMLSYNPPHIHKYLNVHTIYV